MAADANQVSSRSLVQPMLDEGTRDAPHWLQGLLQPSAYDHATSGLRLVETHISWLVLTGPYAYKIKKPVNLGFLDFSSPAGREFYCHEEIRLNSRYAAPLYRDVVTITDDGSVIRINGSGPVLEHAVRMHQFDEQSVLLAMLRAGRLPAARVDELAGVIADFHARAEVARELSGATAMERAWRPAAESLDYLQNNAGRASLALLQQVDARMRVTRDRFAAHFKARLRQGYWRECHGDLHLNNIVIWRNQVMPFDGIEFSDELRWIDVMSDLAFTIMDFMRQGAPELGYLLLSRYLDHSGDDQGLALLDFYLVYRMLVRAKVHLIRQQQEQDARGVDRELVPRLEMMLELLGGRIPFLLLTHGVSGSGKSHWSEQISAQLGMIHMRSDVERRREALTPKQRYTAAARNRVYRRLAERAATALAAGFPVLADATFLHRRQRDHFRQLAREQDVPLVILRFHADQPVLEQRVEQRRAAGRDPSEAGVEVLRKQLEEAQPPRPEEADLLLHVDTGSPVDLDALLQQLSEIARDRS